MEALLVALIFTVTLRRKVTRTDEARLAASGPRSWGFASLVLWFGVMVGRARDRVLLVVGDGQISSTRLDAQAALRLVASSFSRK